MTSKHLYFKLFREDMKRKIWAAALLGLSLFFILPVAVAVALTSYQPDDKRTMAEVILERISDTKMLLGFGNSYLLPIIILFFAAVVMGIASFSYLHNSKQIDFYHSLPVKRGLWFWVHISTGILMTGVIYFSAIVLSLIVAAVNGVLPGLILGTALFSFLCHMLYYCLVYMTVVLAMMLTGTKIAAILGTAVFFSYCPAVCKILIGFCEIFLETYYSGSPNFWKDSLLKLSPVYAIGSAIDRFTWGKAVSAVIAVLILGICSYFLYQKRPSEAAGRTMAFSWSKGIIKVLLVLAFGMAGAIFFYAIRESLGWTVFGVIVGVVISHCVIEVIYYADFKKLFFHEKTMALCMAACLIFVLSFYFDWFHFDGYVPEESQVACASISFNRDNWVSYGVREYVRYSNENTNYILDNSGMKNSAPILSIAKEAVRQMQENEEEANRYHRYNYGGTRITICYTLKSGRKVYRSYLVDFFRIIEFADEIYQNPEYKQVLYPGIAIEAKDAAKNIIYQDANENTHVLQGNPEQLSAVVEAYREDLINLSFFKRTEENPFGEILLISSEDMEELDTMMNETRRYYYYRYNGYFYPIYPSFSKTIQALQECGVDVQLSVENLERIVITSEGPFELEDEKTDDGFAQTVDLDEQTEPYVITYTDKADMEKIMEVLVFDEITQKNGMAVLDVRYNIELTINNRKLYGQPKRGKFQKDKVPEFVVEDFLEEKNKK